jgi:hypothetical protein
MRMHRYIAFLPALLGGCAAGQQVAPAAEPASAALAPVPAGELIVLTARTDAGGELVLPPRTFAIDAEWTWEIPAGTPFGARVRPREDER